VNDLITSSDTMTSIQIADLIGKQHPHIMRDIRDELEKLEAGGVNGESKFGLSSYTTDQNKELPCYILTREGILQLAARYDAVTRAKLIEMAMRSEQSRKAMSQIEILASVAAEMAKQEQQMKVLSSSVESVQTEVQEMREVIELTSDNWRKGVVLLVNRIARKGGGCYKAVWEDIYKNLNSRLGANLDRRLDNKRMRMAENGSSKTERESITKLDIIGEDKKLIDGTVHLIKILAVKNGVRWSEKELQ